MVKRNLCLKYDLQSIVLKIELDLQRLLKARKEIITEKVGEVYLAITQAVEMCISIQFLYVGLKQEMISFAL